jgi:hypothetical protein
MCGVTNAFTKGEIVKSCVMKTLGLLTLRHCDKLLLSLQSDLHAFGCNARVRLYDFDLCMCVNMCFDIVVTHSMDSVAWINLESSRGLVLVHSCVCCGCAGDERGETWLAAATKLVFSIKPRYELLYKARFRG